MNDLGFHGRVDYRSVTTFLGRRVNEARGPFRNYGYSAYTFHAWNFAGDQILNGGAANVNATFRNFWNGGFTLGMRPSYASDRLTRGGPLALVTPQRNVNVNVGTDPRRSVAFTADASYRREEAGPRDRSAGINVDIRPSPAVRLRFGPRFNLNELSQYLVTVPDAAAGETFGARYVFADLKQTTFSMETRLDWTYTPRLSLQLYAQPFISSGSFTNFKEFAAPGTFDFDVYGGDRGAVCRFGGTIAIAPVASAPCPATAPAPNDPDFRIRFANPDFTVRSLRGNAVLRWEYRPGSALFFVWQQDRGIRDDDGTFDLASDFRGLFTQPATNVFLIKASYWFGT